MNRYLSVKEVLRIHYLIIAQFGGVHGVRDLGLLESAVARPQAGFGDFESYPELWDKAAVLLHSLAKNHAFLDGNKRTALLVIRLFLKRNGYLLQPDHDTAASFVADVASSKVPEHEISRWLKASAVRREQL